MEPEAFARLRGLQVRRCFEAGRLAGDFQARAYEQIVPVAGRSEFAVMARIPDAGNRIESNPLTEEGVAA
jgi:hypothetical protein